MFIMWTIVVLLMMYLWFVAVFTFDIFQTTNLATGTLNKFGVTAIGFVIGALGVAIVYYLGRKSDEA